MAKFTFDTSGAVPLRHTTADGQAFISTLWPDLSPFEQGYVEALFASFEQHLGLAPMLRREGTPEVVVVGFSDLARETLEAFRKDCAAFMATPQFRAWSDAYGSAAKLGISGAMMTYQDCGSAFWFTRNLLGDKENFQGDTWADTGHGYALADACSTFPPLTFHIRDDKIYQVEAV